LKIITGSEKLKLKTAFESSNTLATVLFLICVDRFQFDFFDWDPEVLADSLSNLCNCKITQLNMDKIQALINAHVSDQTQVDWQLYNATVQVLSSDPFDPDILEIADPFQCAWGTLELQLLLGEFEPSDEVSVFVGTVLADAGVHTPPSPLKWAHFPVKLENDDPLLQRAGYEQAQSLKGEIDSACGERLQQLVVQLKSVPFENRDDESFSAFESKIYELIHR